MAFVEPLIGPADEPRAPNRKGDLRKTLTLVIENIQCGSCMGRIERALAAVPGVASARVSLASRRATVIADIELDPETLIDRLETTGYRAAEVPEEFRDTSRDRADELLRRLGVAGFAAANVMLLSVSVWAGAASDMDPAAADLFHWISALIAMPAVAYAAQPFFGSAARALRARSLNMDVPISLGIILATGMSVFQTIRHSEQVYFDAAVTLTFFLLIGRYLDEVVRSRARGAGENLLGLKALFANVVASDGTCMRVSARALTAGMRVQVAVGERIPVDGRLVGGPTEIDTSLITGESLPRQAHVGDIVHAGTINLARPVVVEATATDDGTLLAEIARLVRAAEQGRGSYVRLADRAARFYAPAVHVLGAATFIGWFSLGFSVETALTYAVAVLIITCPCALALAVPAVQVAAASRLFEGGIILKVADGLERLAEVDTIVMDKTGTLTVGEPRLVNGETLDDKILSAAASLAAASRHPKARAVERAARQRGLDIPSVAVEEIAGEGLVSTTASGGLRRLGSALFVGASIERSASTLWYGDEQGQHYPLTLDDDIRSDASEVVDRLRAAGYRLELLSGDRANVVVDVARRVGITCWSAEERPAGKLRHLEAIAKTGGKVLMVGDGLNDAPSLAAAHASLAPASGADISQMASDAVFLGERLEPVVTLLGVARAARAMSLQNFAIALAYNVVSVPLAMAGHVTPLIAALAMSLSSIAVSLNALRLRRCCLPLEAGRST